MNHQQILNLVLVLTSFIFLFAAIVMDFFDHKYGKFWTRLIYFLMMIYTVGEVIRVCDGISTGGRVYLLVVITALFFVRKIYQLRDEVEIFEKHLEHKTRLFHKSLHQ